MSSRLIAVIGLVCLVLAVTVMYFPFVDVYAVFAASETAKAAGDPVPVAVTPFVWPTELPAERARTVLLSLVFAAVSGGCLISLARRRPMPAQA
jgi:hypothetical protein